MTRLVLIAHAATAATRAGAFAADEPLDEHGLAATRAATVRRHDGAVCSPARRCVQTADALGLRATIEPALRDCDFGRWQGRAIEDVAAAEPEGIRAWLSDPDAAPHGGESIREVLVRTAAWLGGQAATAGTVVVITHAAVVRAVIIEALSAGAAAFWRIDVSPLSETMVVGGDGRWTLRAMGRPLG